MEEVILIDSIVYIKNSELNINISINTKLYLVKI